MEEKKLSMAVPRRSLIYLLICGAGILSFVLAGIYPSYRNMSRLDSSIADLKARIQEQKILFPMYQKLREELRPEASKAQPSPPKSGLPAGRMDDLSPILSEIAAKCGMEVSTVTPDLKSLSDTPHFLSVGLVLRGSFFNLRRFLLELADLPYLEDILELQIQGGVGDERYFLKIWLMIEDARPASG
jgi:hypothetical protein